jgi:hypothetical protein
MASATELDQRQRTGPGTANAVAESPIRGSIHDPTGVGAEQLLHIGLPVVEVMALQKGAPSHRFGAIQRYQFDSRVTFGQESVPKAPPLVKPAQRE